MNASCYRFPLLFLLSPAPAGLAQATNTLALHPDLPAVGVSALRAFGTLAIVFAIFFAGVWLFRNGQRIAWRKTGPPKLAILETRTLGNRFALYVVGYEQQRLLVGGSPAGLILLTQLPPVAGTGNAAAAPSENASFTQCLQRVLNRK
jgi:flagellar biogenesis protein FliO